MHQSRFLYYSQAVENISKLDIDNILSMSLQHNKQAHISGLLFFYKN